MVQGVDGDGRGHPTRLGGGVKIQMEIPWISVVHGVDGDVRGRPTRLGGRVQIQMEAPWISAVQGVDGGVMNNNELQDRMKLR